MLKITKTTECHEYQYEWNVAKKNMSSAERKRTVANIVTKHSLNFDLYSANELCKLEY